ncbi:MAG: nucleotidyltransferase domain-containing protein, partial [Candidatus Woesearchaeota archaeon]|nr:nucleotidyltransferase domain-containing protein [Candidatus Woesearchaeota archaeon]
KKKTKTLNQKMLPYTKWHTKAIQHPEQERLKALVELHDELRKHDEVFLALILQGSCANLDFTNFSDIDCIVVLRKKVLQNPTLLIHARNIIVSCRIYLDLFQPWNHHGFMIWSELDLENYRESLLPVALLKKSVLFSEGNTLFLHAISESEENLKVKVSKLIKKCERIKAMKPKNITELLDKIASCVLIPTLYLALQKKYTTKKDSFKQFLPLLSKTNQKMFWQVASVWKSWPFKESTPYGIRKRAHKLINPLLFKTFMFNKRNPNSIRKYAQILNKIDKLCDAYLALVRRNFDV